MHAHSYSSLFDTHIPVPSLPTNTHTFPHTSLSHYTQVHTYHRRGEHLNTHPYTHSLIPHTPVSVYIHTYLHTAGPINSSANPYMGKGDSGHIWYTERRM